ncbi:MAG TPA: hypothetical protein VG733_19880 [Chthoniobacteraceae bacterium]|nr:hypothetical protein [Chthoniobacteraceae bacterium]
MVFAPMQENAGEPRVKRAFSFLKAHWPWLFVIAAIAVAAVRYMPAVFLAGITSDSLQAVLFFHDVFEQGHSAHGWVFGGHSDLVPDVSLVFLLQFFLRNGILVLQIVGAFFFIGWIVSITVIHRQCGGRNGAVFMGLLTLYLMAATRGFFKPHGVGFENLFSVGYHGGTEMMAFVCAALLLRVVGTGGRNAFWWLAALCFLTTASDALFVVIFPIPMLAALFVARLRRPSQVRFRPLAGNLVFSTAAGLLAGRRIFPGIVGGYTHFDAAGAAHAWSALWNGCRPSAGGDFVLFVAIEVLALIGGLLLIAGPLARKAGEKLPASIHLLLLYGAGAIAADWGAAILTGDFMSLGAMRYVRFALLLPGIALVAWINHRIRWSRVTGALAAIALPAVIVWFALRGQPSPDE